jgi:hypothetical protein
LQRGIAILLAFIISFMLMLPALAASPGSSNLPACCLKNGRHHCTGGMGQPGVQTITEKCPFVQHASVPAGGAPIPPSNAVFIFAGLVHHPACSPQIEAHRRISFSRSRQKRGPPSFLLS